MAGETSNESLPTDRRFDLLVTDRADTVARWLPHVDEGGGHVVAFGEGARAAAGAMDRAGLEILRPPCGGVAVARRRPPRKPLSLTVGMISMNEERAVGAVIDDIKSRAPDAEVLLVDSSKDETPRIAESRGARVVRQFPPRGYGPAMHRLLYEATTDVIVTMDCDSTYPADRIAQLRDLVEQGADLVNATRTRRRPTAMPLENYIANRLFAGAARVLHGLPTTDVHSGMRAYRTSMLRGMEVDPRGPALPVELYVVPARIGYRIVEVEIPYFERVGSSTLNRYDSTVWTFKRLLRSHRQGARVSIDRVRVV
jgi:glycosyltransferase involved in cell wall biosynthesis